jgi:glutaminyl-peptide cyclotransferase
MLNWSLGRNGSVRNAVRAWGIGVSVVAALAMALTYDRGVSGQVARLPVFGYTIVHSYPHDRDAFTQGLEYVDGVLYEGTGLKGRSSIRRVKLETGEVLQSRPLDATHFGEGVTIFGTQLFQLTWQSEQAFVYDRATFAPRTSYRYRGEGWGLTHDRTSLIMSDGTEYLRFLDPATFTEQRRVRVLGVGQPVKNLNELEYVKGEVFANVWLTDFIVRIDPQTGRVIGYVDLEGLLPLAQRGQDAVLNGIAYDAANDRLFVTGKLWPRLFEIKVSASPVR